MSRYVIDASAAAEYLLKTKLGFRVADLIAQSPLLAPELMDVEVMSVFRRAVLRQQLTEERALEALQDLFDWQVERIPNQSFIQEAWQYRHNVSAYDACYVAVARIYDLPLLTADGLLTRAPNLGIRIQNIRIEEPEPTSSP